MSTLLSHSLLLKENTALASFCKKLRQDFERTRHTRVAEQKSFVRAAIVCERKEDVLAVRSHVFSELRDLSLGQDALSGVSTYTVDSLARSLVQWAMLAVRTASRRNLGHHLGALSQAQLAKPYIDIVTQEKLVRHVLLTLGYKNPDALPLAKQILTLVDSQLPEDLSLIDLFLRSHDSADSKTQKSGFAATQGTRSLAYILSALQATRGLFSPQECMRLQTFVTQGLELAPEGQLEMLVDCLLPEIPALHADLLWFEGPCYALLTDLPAWNSFKLCKTPREIDAKAIVFEYQPGNFGSMFTKSLASYVHALRDMLAAKARTDSSTHKSHKGDLSGQAQAITSRTYVSAPQFQKIEVSSATSGSLQKTPFQSFQFEEIVVFSDLNHFLKSSQEILAELDEKDFALLGDVSTEHARVFTSNGAGRYAPCDEDINSYFALKNNEGKDLSNHTIVLPQPVLELLQNIEAESTLYDEILRKHSSLLTSCLKSYGLEMGSTSPKERVRLLALESEYKASNASLKSGPLSSVFKDLPQALSFFPSNTVPSRWIVFGRPHSSKQASVNVRALNDVLFALIKKGVPLTVPASDFMYRIFWKSLFAGNRPVVLLLQSEQDFDELVESLGYAPSEGIVRKQADTPRAAAHAANDVLFRFLTEGLYPALDSNWKRKFTEQITENLLGVTAFADYVNCPLQFYLKHVLKLSTHVQDPLAFDSLAVGTQTHRVLELLLTSINFAFHQMSEETRANFGHFIAYFLSQWMGALLKPEIFSAQNEASWVQATLDNLEQVSRSAAAQALNSAACIHSLRMTLPEVLQVLFQAHAAAAPPTAPTSAPTSAVQSQHQHQDQLKEKLGLEARKRFFIRFLHAEAERIRADLEKNRVRVTAFVEHPVKLRLSKDLELQGTIDRIDSVFDLSSHKLLYQEIIDYKTSKPLSDAAELILFPAQAQQKNAGTHKAKGKADTHLSVQGGIYILAFAAEKETKETLKTPLAFSLLRLGSLAWATDPYLSVHLGARSASNNESVSSLEFDIQLETELDEIRTHYTNCADRLSAGHFEAAPRDEALCGFCVYQVYCPRGNNPLAAKKDRESLTTEEV